MIGRVALRTSVSPKYIVHFNIRLERITPPSRVYCRESVSGASAGRMEVTGRLEGKVKGRRATDAAIFLARIVRVP